MRRVLIVDDEYLVRVGLKTTIDWQEHGFEIVGEAANGKEAIALFEKTDPDILLTDIKMPAMDGIELIEILKARKPSLHIVILSNHSDFAYAQKAMKLGVKDYLLKSDLNQRNILQTLQRVVLSMAQAQEIPQRKEESPLRDYLREYLLAAKEGQTSLAPAYALPHQQMAAILCRCDTKDLPIQSQPMFYRFSQSMLGALWHGNILASAQKGSVLLAALLVPLAPEDDFTRLIHKAKLATNNIRQYYNINFQTGISQPGASQQLALLLGQASQACQTCFYTQEAFCLYQNSPHKIKRVQVDQKSIMEFITDDSFKPLEAYISSIFTTLATIQSHTVTEAAFIDLLSCARQLVVRYPFLEEHFHSNGKLSYTKIDGFESISACRCFVIELFSTIFLLLSGQKNSYPPAIGQVLDYIHNHYQKNIALSDAAERVCLSNSHLSQLFKQETGINFTRYLTDYRIEKAKELFKTTHLHIYQVAEQVGIPNPYYFSKVFKDSTGLSCKAYRNKIQSEK